MVEVHEAVTLGIGRQLGLVRDELSRVGELRVERAGVRDDVGRDRRPVEPFARRLVLAIEASDSATLMPSTERASAMVRPPEPPWTAAPPTWQALTPMVEK